MTYGKAFGGGIMPITGIICKPKLWVQEIIDNPWLLGSPTFGGNPVCCAAALATIKYMLEHDIPGVCKRKGEVLKAGLEALAKKYPKIIQAVRGLGLMLAVEFHTSEMAMRAPRACLPGRYSPPGPWSTPKPFGLSPQQSSPSRTSRMCSPAWMRPWRTPRRCLAWNNGIRCSLLWGKEERHQKARRRTALPGPLDKEEGRAPRENFQPGALDRGKIRDKIKKR